MRPDDFERARPHLTAMGEVAGGELDALAAVADRNPPVLRTHDETGRRVEGSRHDELAVGPPLDHRPAVTHAFSHRLSPS